MEIKSVEMESPHLEMEIQSVEMESPQQEEVMEADYIEIEHPGQEHVTETIKLEFPPMTIFPLPFPMMMPAWISFGPAIPFGFPAMVCIPFIIHQRNG